MSKNSDADNISRLARIATAFELSRFEALDVRWGGGVLRLRKGGTIDNSPPAAVVRIVPAPRVGIFRAADLAGIPISRTAPLGFIDVLGDMHEVTAPIDGTLAECCVADGSFVEYGAPLFRLTVVADR